MSVHFYLLTTVGLIQVKIHTEGAHISSTVDSEHIKMWKRRNESYLASPSQIISPLQIHAAKPTDKTTAQRLSSQ